MSGSTTRTAARRPSPNPGRRVQGRAPDHLWSRRTAQVGLGLSALAVAVLAISAPSTAARIGLPIGLLVGLAGGVGAGRLADVLPRWMDIRHLVVGRKRLLRNDILLAIVAACGVGLADLALRRAETATPLEVVVSALLIVGIAAASAIDFEHMVLPLEITATGTLIALGTAYFRPIGLRDSLIGAGMGLAVTFLPFLLYKAIRGHSGMGLGDTALAILAGAWHGSVGAMFVLLAGVVQNVLCAAIMHLLGISYTTPESVVAEIAELRAKAEAGDEEAKAALADDPMAAEEEPGLMKMRLPWGPFLALSCVEFVFGREWILEAAQRWLVH